MLELLRGYLELFRQYASLVVFRQYGNQRAASQYLCLLAFARYSFWESPPMQFCVVLTYEKATAFCAITVSTLRA